MNRQGDLIEALRMELAEKERELAHHKLALERFQLSPAWRLTAPIRWVVNRFRNLSHRGQATGSTESPDPGSRDSLESLVYFTGLCRVSLENFFTSGASLELPHNDNSTMSGVLRDLAVKDREIEDQKWVMERFLESPAWRWTAPVRWIARRIAGPNNVHESDDSLALENQAADRAIGAESTTALEAKSYFTDLCRKSLENFLASGTVLELPRSDSPTLSIVIVLFNRAELTFACLRSIAMHGTTEEAEVIVVDNASTDETSRLLERLRGARVIRNDANRHFLAAANQAAHECRGEHLLLLNNDAQLMPGALQSALQTIRSSPDIGAVGAKIVLLDGTLQEAGSIVWSDGSCAGYGRGDDPFAPMYSFRRDVDYCSGAFLLTPLRIWKELGGFDPVFEPAYYEETDYCMRLWQRGLRVVYEPAAAILHYEFASSKDAASATSLQARHQLIFVERHRKALEHQQSPSPDQFLRARARNAERRILVIDDRVPHPWLGAGFPRAHALHQALQRLGYFVTLYPIDVINEPWEQAYADFPREVEIVMGMGRKLLELFLRNRRGYYSTVIVSRPHNMQLLAAIRTNHSKWFEQVDVLYDAEALFADREIARRRLAGNPMSGKEVHAVVAAEVSLADAADGVITVSENDAKVFRKHGVKRVEVLGHSVEVIADESPFESREGLLFVGAVHDDASPNADSLIWFLSEVFPRVREKLGDIPFIIAGVNRSQRIRELAHPPVSIVGHLTTAMLDDLYAKSRVFVAPTRYAAGIPHKIHEAAAHGLPVVATPLLAEQLGWTARELAVAQGADAFAESCIATYTDKAKWNGLREAALVRTMKECSTTAFMESVRRLLVPSGAIVH